jgi:hypothetical protein
MCCSPTRWTDDRSPANTRPRAGRDPGSGRADRVRREADRRILGEARLRLQRLGQPHQPCLTIASQTLIAVTLIGVEAKEERKLHANEPPGAAPSPNASGVRSRCLPVLRHTRANPAHKPDCTRCRTPAHRCQRRRRHRIRPYNNRHRREDRPQLHRALSRLEPRASCRAQLRPGYCQVERVRSDPGRSCLSAWRGTDHRCPHCLVAGRPHPRRSRLHLSRGRRTGVRSSTFRSRVCRWVQQRSGSHRQPQPLLRHEPLPAPRDPLANTRHPASSDQLERSGSTSGRPSRCGGIGTPSSDRIVGATSRAYALPGLSVGRIPLPASQSRASPV